MVQGNGIVWQSFKITSFHIHSTYSNIFLLHLLWTCAEQHLPREATKEHWGNHSGSNDFGFDVVVPSRCGCVARKRPHPHSTDATNLWPLWGDGPRWLEIRWVFNHKVGPFNSSGFVPFWPKHDKLEEAIIGNMFNRGMPNCVAPTGGCHIGVAVQVS